jgi:hypothetical protein
MTRRPRILRTNHAGIHGAGVALIEQIARNWMD